MKNNDKAKKLKAAITGVMYYLQEEENKKVKTSRNTWSRSGREIIMQNRMAVQSRSFGIHWLRK